MRWLQGKRMNEPIRMHSIRKDESRLFILLCDGQEIPSLYTHWLLDQRRSVPCDGDDHCQHHARPLIWKAYAPVLMYKNKWSYGASTSAAPTLIRNHVAESFHRRALELTHNVGSILEQLKRGDAFILKRGGSKPNDPLEWINLEAHIDPPRELYFDVRRVVERAMKGVFATPESPQGEPIPT